MEWDNELAYEAAKRRLAYEDSQLRPLGTEEVGEAVRSLGISLVTDVGDQAQKAMRMTFERRADGLYQRPAPTRDWRRLSSVQVAALGVKDRVFFPLARYRAIEFTEEIEATWAPFVLCEKATFIGEEPSPPPLPLSASDRLKRAVAWLVVVLVVSYFVLLQFGIIENPRDRMSEEEKYYEDARDGGTRPF
jgi:hypothetical protein